MQASIEQQQPKEPFKVNGPAIFNAIGSFFLFVITGRVIVAIGNWLILFAGTVSETCLLVGALWITAMSVVPAFITSLVGGVEVVNTLNALCMVAFSLLPEIILFKAIVHCLQLWADMVRNRNIKGGAWRVSLAWAIAYSIPTISFLVLALYTFGGFAVSGGHMNLHPEKDPSLVARCLTAWTYSLLGMIYTSLGGNKFTSTLKAEPAPAPPKAESLDPQQITQQIMQQVVPVLDHFKTNITADVHALVSRQGAPVNYQELARQIAPLVAPKPEPDYSAIAGAIAPHLEARVSAIKTVIIEEIRATISTLPEPSTAPQIEARTSATTRSQRHRSELGPEVIEAKATRSQSQEEPAQQESYEDQEELEAGATIIGSQEERLEAAYQQMIREGNRYKVSGRALAAMAHVNRTTATKWFMQRVHDKGHLFVMDPEPQEAGAANESQQSLPGSATNEESQELEPQGASTINSVGS